tara:strand:- start:1683 stop:2222 length:540 start_codon:yes stop_codon:yes gene_type:complete
MSHTTSQLKEKDACDPSKPKRPQMVKIPNFKNSWQIQEGCSFPNRYNVAYVIRVFYREWENEFGDKTGEVLENLNKIVITWGNKKKTITGIGFDVDGKPLSGKARGLTLMPGYVWVWTNPPYKRIAATALIHELVHASLWSKNKLHGDPDHEGKEFQGWTKRHTDFVNRINSILAYKDI